MDTRFKILLLVALALYVLSPVDVVPGPIDDLILCIMYAMSNKKCIEA